MTSEKCSLCGHKEIDHETIGVTTRCYVGSCECKDFISLNKSIKEEE